MPSDFRVFRQSKPGFILVAVIMSLIIVLIIGTYHGRGVSTCFCITTYVLACSTMSNLLRNVFATQGFDYPLWVTASHFLSTAVAGISMLLHRRARTGIPINVPST